MTIFQKSLTLLAFFCLTAKPSLAQRTSLSITGGVFQIPYSYETPTMYPGTHTLFVWGGKYRGLGINFGFDLSQALSERWFLKAGLRALVSEHSQHFDLMWPSEHNGNGQYEPSLPDEYLQVNKLFLEIPLTLRRVFSSKRFAPFLEAGFSTSYHLRTQVMQTIGGNTRAYNPGSEGVRSVHIAALLAPGFNIGLTRRNSLFFQIPLRYYLNSIETVSKNPGLGFGVETGWRFHFKS